MSNKNVEKYKGMMAPKQQDTSVYDHLIGPKQNPEDNQDPNENTNVDNDVNPNDSVNTSTDDNIPDNTQVNVANIPIAKAKRGIRETHKTKAFYIRNDIAKLIDKDIKTSRRGAMTEIVNALFEEYYKSQGRLK